MARVALRTLTREIEDQIEHGQIDQAIANCRHILTFFPKHVDSYRLLGKAFMEVQRYGDAADVFQRVLSSVPEDFIAHLGMSIIQEDEGNLDEAIWHMERAFEMQPANAAVQGELRRLYGRRDGFEPPKVRLTRGALARMYVKGGLYPQAIAELRSALAEEPQRPDLLILLAKAYYLYGQKVEAADTCNSLLSRLPYSLEGNRLLAEILSGSERAMEAETYRQRVHALDPYSAHISAAAPNPEVVPDGAVTLERLEWRPGQHGGESPSQPEWAASLGVNVEGITPEKETLPEWLSTVPGSDQEGSLSEEGESAEPFDTQQSREALEKPGLLDSPSGLADSLGGSESEAGGFGAAGLGAIGLGAAGLDASSRKDEEIPDWMQEAGWEASKDDAGESGPPVGEGEQAQDEELAPAELPDWLRSMAPAAGLETGNDAGDTTETAPPAEEGEPPEGISSGRQPGSDFLPWLSENPPGASDSVVTWLENKELEPGEPETPGFGQEDLGAVDIPEWLKDMEESGSESGVLAPETMANPPDLPEWSESSQGEGDTGEVPDWLKEMVEKPEEAGIQASEPANEVPSDWSLELGTSAEHAGEPGELETFAEQPVEAAEEAGLPTGGGPESEGELFEQDAAFAWLESLAARQGSEEGLTSSPDEQQETPPEWVQEIAEAPTGQEASIDAELTVETFDLEIPEAAGEGEADVPDWLKVEPDQAEPVATEEPEAAADESPLAAAEVPDWLHGLSTDPGEGEASLAWEKNEEASLEPAEPEELPDWLKETAEPLAVEAEAPSGLASLDEPPVSEGDTKPTRVAKASEVSIPSALAGFVASAKAFLHRKKETESLDETPVETGTAGIGPSDTPVEPQAGEEIQLEVQQEEPQAVEDTLVEALPQEEQKPVEEIQAGEPVMKPPAEEAEPVVEALVPGIGAAVFHLEEQDVEELEGTAAGESGLEETTGQLAEEAVLPDWLIDKEEEPVTHWEPRAWGTEEVDQPTAEVPTGETGKREVEDTASQPEAAGLPDWLREMEEEPDTRWGPQSWDTEETGQPTAEEPASEGELFEQDEAFAWLEGLAARQGADEGLLVSPEERQELPPEWVAAEAAATPIEEEPDLVEAEPETGEVAWSVEVFEQPVEVPVETKEEPGFSESVLSEPVLAEEATGLQVELQEENLPVEDELVAERWVDLPVEEAEEAVSAEELVDSKSIPVEDAGGFLGGAAIEAVFVDGEAGSDLSDLVEVTEETITEEAGIEVPTAIEPDVIGETAPVETPSEEIPELPAWLAGYEQEPAEEELSWTPPAVEPVQIEGPFGAGRPVEAGAEELAQMPERLDLNQAALIELERVPGIGFVRAQALLAYRETHGPLTSIEDLRDVPGFEAETLAQIQDRVMVVAPAGSQEIPVDAHQVALIQARNALAEGDRDKALDQYISLLKGRALLPEVIQDLHEALYRFPVDISIWQALGDAYARNDEFQQAIDAYTKAEELLR